MKKALACQAAIGILLLCTVGCKKSSDETVTFLLRNNTNINIAKAQIFASSTSTALQQTSLVEKANLEKGTSYRQAINVSSLPTSDGGYRIQITDPNNTKSYKFGYFTNGRDLNKDYTLEIEKDTLKVQSTVRDL